VNLMTLWSLKNLTETDIMVSLQDPGNLNKKDVGALFYTFLVIKSIAGYSGIVRCQCLYSPKVGLCGGGLSSFDVQNAVLLMEADIILPMR
jgi:hypothetical protein